MYGEDYSLGEGQAPWLHSIANQYIWNPGPNKTDFMPNEHNGAGFYVMADFDKLQKHVTITNDYIVGVVLGWGRVIQHGHEGWRAQCAKVVALLDAKFSRKQYQRTKVIARRYRVPIMNRAALTMMMKEWGDPLP
jgi:hypothetical protein